MQADVMNQYGATTKQITTKQLTILRYDVISND